MFLRQRTYLLWTLSLALYSCGQPTQDDAVLAPVQTIVDGVPFATGDWETDLPAGDAGFSKGNHRAVVVFEPDSAAGSASSVRAHIPWRRNDPRPEKKGIIVVDASTGAVVSNSVAIHVSNESGDVVFQPISGSGTYYVYYFPYETSGGYYPRLNHTGPTETSDQDWLRGLDLLSPDGLVSLPAAATVRIEAINDFHRFDPMEVIASSSEIRSLLAGGEHDFILFPEERTQPIRMRSFLPKRWADRGLVDVLEGVADRGEYFTFQIGVYAANRSLENLSVSFSDLEQTGGAVIDRGDLTCFNTSGVDQYGRSFSKHVEVEQGVVQPLWIGVSVPDDARTGFYSGTVTVSADGLDAQSIRVNLRVTGNLAQNHGDNDPALMSRLRWLNSTIGTDPDFVIAPYVPVTVSGPSLRVLGREVVLGSSGLPAQIRSYFPPEMTSITEVAEDIIARPIELVVRRGPSTEVWQSEPFEVAQDSRGRATWTTRSRSEHFSMVLEGAVEYEGMIEANVTLVAAGDVDVSDISLPIAYRADAATYLLGLGYTGQYRPAAIDWKWGIEKHQEGLWMGSINKGLQYVLRDENYVRPLNTNFYQTQPLVLPVSWYNGGKGGIRVTASSQEVVADNYSGPRHLAAGDTLRFHVRFLVTPFKPLDTKSHFGTRFVHKYVPVDSVIVFGGTVVNIHHANEINPYINYPFFNLDLLSAYIKEAHEKNVKVKLYDTIRELTYKSYELFALRSLGDEILNDGDGGGHSWLQEHLIDGYHSAWHAYRVDDAAILNKGTSRWTNYYIEGLNWLAENQQIDGLYLDDIAFSRETVKRMISVLNRHRNEVVIDLHSANQFNPRDGFINSAMLYMEHFPFISRLWFGEYFDYDAAPDYWMTEISGLPFGLMGEMLQDCGRPYRGMLYGMTTRMYGDCDPRPVWQMMNEFGTEDSRMLGYWLDASPVHTDQPLVLATTFVRADGVLVAMASWAEEDMNVLLRIDWDKLGLDPAAVHAYAPAIDGLQSFQQVDLAKPIRIKTDQGLFLRIASN